MASASASKGSYEPVEVLITQEALDQEPNARLDRLLAQLCPQFSRTELQRWVELGHVAVDGEAATRKTRVGSPCRVRIQPVAPPMPNAEPQAIALDVLFEDGHLLVIHKPAGLVVHPAPGHPDGTLVNALLHHTTVNAGDDPLRPGIVHRLDQHTSGVMVVVKSEQAHRKLVETFQAHNIERHYEAIAIGLIDRPMTYDTLHGRHPKDRKRFSSKVQRGKRAVTHITPIAPLHGATHIRCTLETGRTHQIRVHLADDRHPILGDSTYGKPSKDPKLHDAEQAIGRQALHAAVLGFAHPVTGEALRFEAPPPEDFQHALRVLGGG